MPMIIPLAPKPNQSLTVRLDGTSYVLTVKAVPGGLTAVTIEREGQTIVSTSRCLPQVPLIPYRYREGSYGNFLWSTGDDAYPHYSRFGSTHTLRYCSAAEMAKTRP